MILIEEDNLAEHRNAWLAVCGSQSCHIPGLWTADVFEWQGIHDNYSKWVCSQY